MGHGRLGPDSDVSKEFFECMENGRMGDWDRVSTCSTRIIYLFSKVGILMPE